jgi:hypothetical protein
MDYSVEYSSGLSGMSPVMIIIWVIVMLFLIASEWKIFTKAGKPGWAILIPIYNIIVFLQIVGRPVWWIILLLIPVVNFIILIILVNDLSKSFGKGVGYTLGLLFLGIIFVPLLGFGSAEYVGPGGSSAQAA